jgi:hypothetical protein
MNHSCVPNCQIFFHGDLAFAHANKPIAEGEEITLDYTGVLGSFEAWTKQMRVTYGFQCKCALCEADAKCPSEDLARRSDVYDEVRTGISTFSLLNRKDSTKMEQYVTKIDRMYDPKLYATLPKLALVPAQSWLLMQYKRFNERSKSRQTILSLLRALCYQVETQDGAINRISHTSHSALPHGPMALFMLGPLMDRAIEAHDSGAMGVAKHLLEFARSVERAGHGTDTDTVNRFKQHVSKPAGKSLSTGASEKALAEFAL